MSMVMLVLVLDGERSQKTKKMQKRIKDIDIITSNRITEQNNVKRKTKTTNTI